MFGESRAIAPPKAYTPTPEIITAHHIIAQLQMDNAQANKLIAGNNAYIERLHRDVDFWKGACERLTWTINNPEKKRIRRKKK